MGSVLGVHADVGAASAGPVLEGAAGAEPGGNGLVRPAGRTDGLPAG